MKKIVLLIAFSLPTLSAAAPATRQEPITCEDGVTMFHTAFKHREASLKKSLDFYREINEILVHCDFFLKTGECVLSEDESSVFYANYSCTSDLLARLEKAMTGMLEIQRTFTQFLENSTKENEQAFRKARLNQSKSGFINLDEGEKSHSALGPLVEKMQHQVATSNTATQ